jgi:hypothetical protein
MTGLLQRRGKKNSITYCIRDWIGFQSQSGGFGEKKSVLSLTDTETRLLGRPVHNLVTILTALTAEQVTAK